MARKRRVPDPAGPDTSSTPLLYARSLLLLPRAAHIHLRGIVLGRVGLLRWRQRLAAQHLEGVLQLRVLLRLLRHVAGGSGTFLALLVALQVAAQTGFAGHPGGPRLQLRRQLLLDDDVGID